MKVHFNSKFVKELAEAIGVENWRRIVIDIGYDTVATAYVELLMDEERMDNINIHAGLVLEHTKREENNNDE